MRLLQVDENGEFSLTDDLIDNIPPYAILSHTWGEDHEEVNFKDLTIGPRKTKSGYRKLRFCTRQAARDNLQCVWVDTCCIDKSNNNELSEAINSMFRWYRNAVKCYVYLSDVATNDHDQVNPSLQSWEPALRKSRWFTRGWTLQELLAPSSVEFFCSNGKRLGDKRSLERLLHEITGIAVRALQGAPLFEFSVDERMLWAKYRQTKREEDKAYSLLGIFSIYMPLIYGEGMKSAFGRLQEEIDKKSRPTQRPGPVDRLPYAVEAPFNSYTRQHEPTCLPNTRVDLLQKINNWVDGQNRQHVFWLSGLAGTGKSTIARTIAGTQSQRGCLGASFFFSRDGGDVGHAGKFVTSLARQLANSIPTLHQHICDAITGYSDIASRSLRKQWHQLVLHPLSKLDGTGCQTLYILVVDALDECDDENDIRIILRLLAEVRSLERVRLRVLLTSRPEIPIRHGFCQIPDEEHQDFVLHNISPSIVDHDITVFLEYNLKLIGQERSLDATWPGGEVIRCLVQAASGLFIWAATACRFVREGKRHAARRLDTILRSGGSAGTVTAPEKHLDDIYTTVLKHSVPSEYTDEEKEESYRMLRQVLGSIVVLFATLSVYSLSRLIYIPLENVNQTVEDLHSILNVPKDKIRPLRLHHPSFRDFLLSNSRCQEPNLWVEKKQAHKMLAGDCIRLMSTALKQDVCGFSVPSTLIASVERSQIEHSLLPEVQYACLYWIEHLQRSGTQLRDHDRVHRFLQEHLLHWLEALGWMGKVSEGIHAIASLESFASSSDCPCLSTFVHDTKRFVLYSRSAIEQAPLQAYCSALIFAPSTSIIRMHFKDCIPKCVRKLPKVESNWNALLQTLEGHFNFVKAVAFSPDGKTLASASFDRTLKLWDAGSGAVLQTLEGHSSYVNAVAFSPDGKMLASASVDRTVKLWDAGSGAVLQTLEGHSGSVNAVAFSPDGKTLASASSDRTVKLWDAGSGAVLQTLEGHSDWVSAVALSPDSKTLASASVDRTVKLWDAGSGAVLRTLEGHSSSVYAVAFSPYSKMLASASADRTVKLWDAGSGAVLQTLEGHSSSVYAVAFSPDGKTLASASADRTVKLWDAGSGAVLQTLEGHSSSVNAVAFSPDGKTLASASDNRTVKLWDAGSGAVLQTLEGHSGSVNAVAFSPDGKMLASASVDWTVKLWDAGSGAVLQTLEGHSGSVNAVAFSPDSRTLASASVDMTVKLWDAGSGAVLQTLEGHSNFVIAVAFSPDGKTLASASFDRTVKLWDAGSGAVLQTLEGHSSPVNAVAFSPDSKTLASASVDWPVKLWDAGSGAVLQTLEGHSHFVSAVAFSPDGKMLASASFDKTVKLWDARSGAVLQTLNVDFYINNLLFSDNGTFLQTNGGPLYSTFLSNNAALYGPSLPPSVFVSQYWVSWKGEKLVWLPSEHRPSCVAVQNGTVAFGYVSGRVLVMEFAF